MAGVKPLTKAKFATAPPVTQLLHRAKYFPVSPFKAHLPFPKSSGVHWAQGPVESGTWTNAESAPPVVPASQQLLHLDKYFPESALKATLSPTR